MKEIRDDIQKICIDYKQMFLGELKLSFEKTVLLYNNNENFEKINAENKG
jgi:hypothetical protein